MISTGEIFQGKRLAMEFMIKNNYPQEYVEKVRQSLIRDGWSSNPSLPFNWLYKRHHGSGAERGLHFISDSGVIMKKSDAIIHFQQLGDSISSQMCTNFI